MKGEKVDFDVDIDISGESQFTQKVLRELLKIPYGKVRSYLWIGKRVGHTMASQSRGSGSKKKPHTDYYPLPQSHTGRRVTWRVSPSGIEIKKRLLALEGVFKGS